MSKNQIPERGYNASADRETHGGGGVGASPCSPLTTISEDLPRCAGEDLEVAEGMRDRMLDAARRLRDEVARYDKTPDAFYLAGPRKRMATVLEDWANEWTLALSLPEPDSEARNESELTDLLCNVIRFRRGLGKFNLSHLDGQERWNANDDKWYELESAIESALHSRGIKVT